LRSTDIFPSLHRCTSTSCSPGCTFTYQQKAHQLFSACCLVRQMSMQSSLSQHFGLHSLACLPHWVSRRSCACKSKSRGILSPPSNIVPRCHIRDSLRRYRAPIFDMVSQLCRPRWALERRKNRRGRSWVGRDTLPGAEWHAWVSYLGLLLPRQLHQSLGHRNFLWRCGYRNRL
jgi:hypothetical protein